GLVLARDGNLRQVIEGLHIVRRDTGLVDARAVMRRLLVTELHERPEERFLERAQLLGRQRFGRFVVEPVFAVVPHEGLNTTGTQFGDRNAEPCTCGSRSPGSRRRSPNRSNSALTATVVSR